MNSPIATHANTKEILISNDLWARKELGQNFLVDGFVADKIVRAAEIEEGDLVIEIGPGIGGLTQVLVAKAGEVVAVEIDGALADVLRAKLPNVRVINKDAQRVDLPKIAEEMGFRSFKVVANLPYYITTPLLMGLLEYPYGEGAPRMISATLMMQKEVANRVTAVPGSKDYGALSLGVCYRASAELVANVPRNCFLPRPSVDSAVVHLRTYDTPPAEVLDEQLLFETIRTAFSTRRKTLLNCLANAYPEEQKSRMAQVIAQAGISPDVRAENLALVQFADLSNALAKL